MSGTVVRTSYTMSGTPTCGVRYTDMQDPQTAATTRWRGEGEGEGEGGGQDGEETAAPASSQPYPGPSGAANRAI
eukprot:2639660-Rhodomonas_salina.2